MTGALSSMEQSPISYEDLADLEYEFEEVDTEVVRKQYMLSQPIYAKRQEIVAQIPNFWPLVFEQAPPEIDQYIEPSESELLADCLKTLWISRPEIEVSPGAGGPSPREGNPRSFTIRFEFNENKWFEDTVLEKKFSFRRAKDNWSGLVSEPVRIKWKKGKDLTKGLTDVVCNAWEARMKAGAETSEEQRQLPQVKTMLDKFRKDESHKGFFVWFAFVSTRRYVSAEESEEANKAEAKRRKRKDGEKTEDAEEEPMLPDDAFSEVFPYGEELAVSICEDVWPSAIKFFTSALEDGDGMSEEGFEGTDEDDEDEDEDDDDEPIDIRSLVSKPNGDDGPAKKKRRT